jgi:hypothetical protein
MHPELYSLKLKGRYHFGYLDVGRRIFEWILEKQVMMTWAGFSWLRTETNGMLL